MTESILVVGATGNIGSELVRQLAGAGHRVRALVRDRQKAERITALATPVVGDLTKPETLAEAFDGAERVFILSPTSPETETLEGSLRRGYRRRREADRLCLEHPRGGG